MRIQVDGPFLFSLFLFHDEFQLRLHQGTRLSLAFEISRDAFPEAEDTTIVTSEPKFVYTTFSSRCPHETLQV